jgi:hypothetical protein
MSCMNNKIQFTQKRAIFLAKIPTMLKTVIHNTYTKKLV